MSILFIDIPKNILKESKKDLVRFMPITNFENITSIGVSIFQNMPADFLSQFPKLKNIHVLGTSIDNIDKDYCLKNNISISNVTHYCDHETAEWIIWQICSFFREKNQSIYEKTLGIIGMGQVGQCLAKKSIGLNIKTLFYSNHLDNFDFAYKTSLEKLFIESDVIAFTKKAYEEFSDIYLFEKLKKEALVINICMGKMFADNFCDEYLKSRSDIKFLFDNIAAKYHNSKKITFIKQNAYETLDSQKRLIKIFLDNCGLN